MNMIKIYEDQRDILISEQQKTNKELKIIQAAGATMSKKSIAYMNELIDYLIYLEDGIDILESRINSIGIIN